MTKVRKLVREEREGGYVSVFRGQGALSHGLAFSAGVIRGRAPAGCIAVVRCIHAKQQGKLQDGDQMNPFLIRSFILGLVALTIVFVFLYFWVPRKSPATCNKLDSHGSHCWSSRIIFNEKSRWR